MYKYVFKLTIVLVSLCIIIFNFVCKFLNGVAILCTVCFHRRIFWYCSYDDRSIRSAMKDKNLYTSIDWATKSNKQQNLFFYAPISHHCYKLYYMLNVKDVMLNISRNTLLYCTLFLLFCNVSRKREDHIVLYAWILQLFINV